MAGLTRKELKQDEFHDIYEEFFEYLKREIGIIRFDYINGRTAQKE